MLQEGEGDHGHQRVTDEDPVRIPLKVIKPELLFQLLMRLFANRSWLDRGNVRRSIATGRLAR